MAGVTHTFSARSLIDDRLEGYPTATTLYTLRGRNTVDALFLRSLVKVVQQVPNE